MNVTEIILRYKDGQQMFRRKSVGPLVAEIETLRAALAVEREKVEKLKVGLALAKIMTGYEDLVTDEQLALLKKYGVEDQHANTGTGTKSAGD